MSWYLFRMLPLLLLPAIAGCDRPSVAAGHLPLDLFGRTGAGPREFSYPRAAVILPQHGLFVVDKRGRLQHLTLAGEFRHDWRMPEYRAGKPTGLGASTDGRIFAADTHYARVVVFDTAGNELARFGAYGDAPGRFRMPTDVAVDVDGNIFVGEYGGNDRITRFNPDFEPVLTFGGPDAGSEQLARPQSLVFDNRQRLWVADAGNHRIVCFDREGRRLAEFGELGSGLGQLRFPYGVTVLSDDSLVVTEYGNNRLQRFTSEGQSLGVWGGAGRDPGQLAYPWAAVAAPDDRVFVVDSGNNRIQVIEGRDPDTWTSPAGS